MFVLLVKFRIEIEKGKIAILIKENKRGDFSSFIFGD